MPSTQGRSLDVIRSTDALFKVDDMAVSIGIGGENATCQCGSFWQTGLPCMHMAAVHNDIRNLVHKSYLTSTIREVYQGVIPPITFHDLVADGVTMPQAIRRQAGRPKKLRIRNRSEYIADESPSRCSQCGQPGHNVRTCERRRHQAAAGEQDWRE